jgi:hypothetical protein
MGRVLFQYTPSRPTLLGLVHGYKWLVAWLIGFENRNLLGFNNESNSSLQNQACKVREAASYELISNLIFILCGNWMFSNKED